MLRISEADWASLASRLILPIPWAIPEITTRLTKPQTIARPGCFSFVRTFSRTAMTAASAMAISSISRRRIRRPQRTWRLRGSSSVRTGKAYSQREPRARGVCLSSSCRLAPIDPSKIGVKGERSESRVTAPGGPGESHPRAPTERSVKVSLHSARPI
jgi:hypothetical protein